MKIQVKSLTVQSASAVFQAVDRAIAAGDLRLDFSEVQHVDSVALAVVLHARRQAGGRPLQLEGLPAQFSGLVSAYGVQSLFE